MDRLQKIKLKLSLYEYCFIKININKIIKTCFWSNKINSTHYMTEIFLMLYMRLCFMYIHIEGIVTNIYYIYCSCAPIYIIFNLGIKYLERG